MFTNAQHNWHHMSYFLATDTTFNQVLNATNADYDELTVNNLICLQLCSILLLDQRFFFKNQWSLILVFIISSLESSSSLI